MSYDAIHNSDQSYDSRAFDFFREHQYFIFRRTDRLFAVLLTLQWFAAILTAYFLSPIFRAKFQPDAMSDVYLAFLLGGAIVSLPTFLSFLFPGEMPTRYFVAVCQMLMSGLIIHLTGGRIESHFHIFGSLAFLSLYRDWRVLIPATIITALDHYFRGIYFPFSIYGNADIFEWRWAEHLGWIIFEDAILIVSIRRTIFKMRLNAFRNAAVEAKEEKYRAVVEQTSDGIALIEPKSFRIIECNEAFSRLLGCSTIDEAKNYRPKGLECENDWLQKNRLINTKQFQSFANTDKKLVRRNGNSIPVETNVNLISYGGKEVFCVNIKDITERKRAEIELARLAIVAQKTQNAVIITDDQGTILWINEGFTTLTGYKFEEVVGNLGYFLQGEQTDSVVVETIRTTMWARKPFSGEIYNYAKDGRGFWVSISITPWHNDKGEIQGFVSILTDITERKAIEEELRRAQDELETRVAKRTSELSEAQQFLRTVIDSVPNLIFVKDAHGRYKLANKAVADFLGTSHENLTGKTFADFHTEKKSVENILIDDRNLLDDSLETVSREQKFIDADGKSRWLQVVKVPLELGEDNSRNVLGIVTDLTERKQLENQLRHSQKMESIGQLAAGIAHEINTPTQYVSDNTMFIRDSFTEVKQILDEFNGFLTAAKNGGLDAEKITELENKIKKCDLEFLTEEIPRAVEQSLEGVSRISKIVSSMRIFAYPGAVEKQPADINRAIESTISVANNEWKYVAEMETVFDESLPLVPCLLDEFNRVVLNMIINASHSISEAVEKDSRVKGKITIKTSRIADRWAEIQISDTGAGIPPEVQSRIFDPFFTTKEVGKGTGQGLAISHNVIVEKHKGQILFESEQGSGTTFFIRLPLIDIQSPATEPAY